MNETYWFADVADEEDGMVQKDGSPYWKAWLQIDQCGLDLPLWFETEEAAWSWIASIPSGNVQAPWRSWKTDRSAANGTRPLPETTK